MIKLTNRKNTRLIIIALTSSSLLFIFSGMALWFYFTPKNINVNATVNLIQNEPVVLVSRSPSEINTTSSIATQQSEEKIQDEKLPPITAEMAEEIRRLGNRSTEGLIETKHADGSVSVDLQGRFQSVAVAVRGPDGKLIVRHGEDFLNNVAESGDK